MSTDGLSRRGFLATTGTVAAAPVHGVLRSRIAVLSDDALPPPLLQSPGAIWANAGGGDPAPHFDSADGVVVATADLRRIESIPVSKPLFWMSPLPADPKWLRSELARREGAALRFPALDVLGDAQRVLRDRRELIVGSLAYAPRAMEFAREAWIVQLPLLRAVWPELELGRIVRTSNGFDAPIGRQPQCLRYELRDPVYGPWWGVQFVTAAGMFEVMNSGLSAHWSYVPGYGQSMGKHTADVLEQLSATVGDADGGFQKWITEIRGGRKPGISPAPIVPMTALAARVGRRLFKDSA